MPRNLSDSVQSAYTVDGGPTSHCTDIVPMPMSASISVSVFMSAPVPVSVFSVDVDTEH